MSEEEKKAIEYLKELTKQFEKCREVDLDKEFDNKQINTYTTILQLIEKQQKELNSLKEIEQQHQEDNGLLRQELDMQIEHNKELEATLKQTQDSWFEDTQKIEQQKLNDKEKEIIESYRNFVKETGVDTGWVICNPATMWSNYFVSMETEKAIERLKKGIEDTVFSTLYSQEQEEEDIKTVLKELEKKNKMIELIKSRIFVSSEEHEEILKVQEKHINKKHVIKSYDDCTIEYFENKVEESE